MPGIQPVIREIVTGIGNANAGARVATATTAATTKVGDWLVAIHSHDWGTAAQLPTPGGTYTGTGGAWTKRAGGNTGAINQVHSGVYFRKVLGAGATGTNAGAQTVTSSGAATSSDVVLMVLVFDGATVDATDPFDVAANVANGGGAAVTPHVAPAVDPTDDGLDGTLFTVHSAQKNVTYTVPTGMTPVGAQLVSQTFVTQLVSRLALTGTAAQADAAQGTKTATASVASGYAACTFAIKGRSGATPTYTSSKASAAPAAVPPPGFAVAYGVTTNGGRAEIAAATTNGTTTNYAGLKSADQVNGNLTLDSVHLEVVGLPTAQAGQVAASPAMLWLMAASQPAGTRVGFEFDPRSGELILASQVNYGGTVAVLRFDPVWHRWWRLERSGTNLLWETSREGVTWQQRGSIAAPAWVLGADLSFSIEAYRTTGVSDSFDIRSINTTPDPIDPHGEFLHLLAA